MFSIQKKKTTPKYLLFAVRNLLENRQIQVRIDNTLFFSSSPNRAYRKDHLSHPFCKISTVTTYTTTTNRTKTKLTKRPTHYYNADDTALIVHDKTTQRAASILHSLT